MATRRIATDESGGVALELSAAEYETVRWALAQALMHTRDRKDGKAAADKDELVRLMSSLDPTAFAWII